MSLVIPNINGLNKGDDCRSQFKISYDNRYTWPSNFNGYTGSVRFIDSDHQEEGIFTVNSELKSDIDGINSIEIKKMILNQLWEVTIHRVRREFNDVHKENIFTVGDLDQNGMEIIVGGKNCGDRYRIKNGYVSMVYRHIHGKIVEIYTKKVFDTGIGYLSELYTSEYLNPDTLESIGLRFEYKDEFVNIDDSSLWFLGKRTIKGKSNSSEINQSYEFFNMKQFS